MKDKKALYIILGTLLTIILLYLSDQIFHLNYISKVIIKLVLFLAFPIIYILRTKQNFAKNVFKHDKKRLSVKLSYILGVLIFFVLIGVFVYIKQYMNIDVLIAEFEGKYKINKSNILYYGLYLTFINSFLEEFFFRGFIFLNLKHIGWKKTAYIFSSLAFSIYHVSNFQNWFNIWVFFVAIIGLFIGGIIFNLLDDKENTFINSWYVHICADLALVCIGLRLFGVI